MPWCVAVGCSNNAFSKNHEKVVSYYSFPKVKNLKKRSQIGRSQKRKYQQKSKCFYAQQISTKF